MSNESKKNEEVISTRLQAGAGNRKVKLAKNELDRDSNIVRNEVRQSDTQSSSNESSEQSSSNNL